MGSDGKFKNSVRIKKLLRAGKIPAEYTKNLDMDRLQEDEEDFTAADMERLAINPNMLQPITLSLIHI